MKTLSQNQEACLRKLSPVWASAYEIGFSIRCLDSLVQRGLAVKKTDSLGAIFSPRTATHYKLKADFK